MKRTAGVFAAFVVAATACGCQAASGSNAVTSTAPSAPTAAPKSSTAPKSSSSAKATPSATPHSTSAAWSDDFTGAAGTVPDPTLFQYRTGGNGWGNQELETYTARTANASLDGQGNLVLRAIHEPYTGTDGIARNWTSARLDSLGKWTFTTGTIAIRMKVAPASGIWPAFWLEGANLPQVGWPQAGEIDVVELFGIQSYVFQTLHGPQGTTAAYQVSANTPIPSGTSVGANYHVFSVTRTPGQIQFRIDGNLSGTLTRANLKSGQSWVYDTPMFVTLNLAVGGFAGAPTAATPSRAQLLVDWIRYYPS